MTESVEVGRRLSRRCLDPGALRSEDDVAAEVVIGFSGLRIGFGRIESEESVRPGAEDLLDPCGVGGDGVRRGRSAATHVLTLGAFIIGVPSEQRNVVLLPLGIGRVDILWQKPAIDNRAPGRRRSFVDGHAEREGRLCSTEIVVDGRRPDGSVKQFLGGHGT